MSAFMEWQGFKTVSFEKSMRCHQNTNGYKIMMGSHSDDFCMCSINHACLDKFIFAMLDSAKGRFEGTYQKPLHL